MRLSPKLTHEVRCPIHGFVRFNNLEREVIDSPPVQRLKHIHQLAMTYQVYPGATHRRFEHSLGVMDLAGRAFDVLTQREPCRTALPRSRKRWMTTSAGTGGRFCGWRHCSTIPATFHSRTPLKKRCFLMASNTSN
jgi:hypothetical protein